MHWSERWIGLAYVPLGRGPDGYDCLGLFLAVQAAEFGRVLDYGLVELGSAEGAEVARHIGEWHRCDQAVPGDAVLLKRGAGWHLGVAIDNARMLHAFEADSAIESFRTRKWGQRLEGIYRFGHG